MQRGETDDDYERRLDRIRRIVGEERFALGVQLIEARHDPLAIAAGLSRVAEAALEARGRGGLRRVRAGPRQDARRRAGRARARPAGRRRADPRLGPRPRLPVHRRDRRRIGRPAPARAPRSTSTASPSASPPRSACRPPKARSTRSTRGSAARQPGAARGQPRQLRALPARAGLDLGAHGAVPRAAGVRLGRGARRARADRRAKCSKRRAIRTSCAPTCSRCAPRSPSTSRRPGPLDAKLLRGGLVDCEFIVHFLQLRERTAFRPRLGEAIGELVAAGLLPAALRRAPGADGAAAGRRAPARAR